MPLRDHFRPPLNDLTSWDGFHGQWPAMIVLGLARRLPRRYVAAPHVHLGTAIEVDVATFEGDEPAPNQGPAGASGEGGGVAVAPWAPPGPSVAVASELPEASEYEVRVYDARRGRRLVAAVELVSSSNKDRPEHRRMFISRCAELLRQGVCVAIIDLVTTRAGNLYLDLLGDLGQADPTLGEDPPTTYAASCRWVRTAESKTFEAWSYPMPVGRALPTLPLWLAPDLAVPLELEASYEETCRVLRIA
ncbi:DUF4058 family protein [Tautonia plasticadhaerens]|uniref:DUF4058 domain-containing protein n=1 Tax=Tautonia plasticadhaerens TaxID=2527974 RepID=A0A518HFP9_9BACT|nr:DUF4058 family protein [Tautonia plasticadhaerens]QDV39665.1 hypothetical protein ElP_76370 [Tautonia plasticadhaerens]